MPEEQGEIFNPELYSANLLLSKQELERIENDDEFGELIALRLKEKNPRVYNIVRACRAAGISIKRTMRLAGVGFHTICAIDAAEKDYIENSKRQMAKECFGGAKVLLETLRDNFERIVSKEGLTVEELQKLTDMFGKFIDKGQLLTGGPTDILEANLTALEYEGWRGWEENSTDAEIIPEQENNSAESKEEK